MNSRSLCVLFALAACITTTRAADIGAFGSYWNTKDGDNVAGGGALILLETLPIEIRGTYYEDNDVPGNSGVQIIPVDAGLTFGLTRTDLFHLLAGGGFSYFIEDADRGDPDNEFGWYLSARLEVPLDNGLSVFGEAMYRGADLDEVDADLSGSTFNVGILF